MLYHQHLHIDRRRPATFLEEFRAVAEVFLAALFVALLGVAMIAIF